MVGHDCHGEQERVGAAKRNGQGEQQQQRPIMPKQQGRNVNVNDTTQQTKEIGNSVSGNRSRKTNREGHRQTDSSRATE